MWGSFVVLALSAPFAHALLRFPCSQLVTQRFDPLVTPGQVAPHIHQIIGGNAFNLSMPPDNDLPALSTCTTCRFKEDFSNYWTAVLYFRHSNGSFIRVPQMANQFVGSPNGGMTVYYIQPNGQKVVAFRKGFRMIVGNAMIRTKSPAANSPEAVSLTFRCFSANFGNNTAAPGMGSDTITLPNRKCEGGIRSNIYWPSCWDGVNLDSADHSSHVAFPQNAVGAAGLFFPQGTCPSTHPVRLPQLFTETVWDTRSFNNMQWPSDGSQPFVYSMGDPTGYGQHGDYVFGWQGDSLQRAMDTCTDSGGVPEQCSVLTLNSDAEINRCTQTPKVPEVTEGYLSALPGCNPIQRGPAQATLVPNCQAVSTISGAPAGPTPTNPVSTNPPASTAPPASTQPPSQGPTVPKWGQCGGVGWTGGTQCVSGTTCTKLNDWYYQCL